MTRSKMFATLGLIALVSVAFMGCSDDDNPVVTPTQAVDTAPPAVPSNLVSDFDGDSAQISWDANTTDSDLEGFLVQKTYYGETTVLVGVPTLSTSITDNNVGLGISTYHVLAVDQVGNESAYATVQVVKSGSKTDYQLDN